ncbi:MAG: N-6 DNA methylase [Acidimicrobiales bacterium]
MVDARAVVVATRAAELAAASGVELRDDLALWRLAGGRPAAAAVAGRPEELGTLLEATIDAPQREARGAHYTPEHLARDLVARALVGHRDPTVCDPACGGGALLLAAARHQIDAGAEPCAVVGRLWGIDIDPLAVATTEASLALLCGAPPPAGHLQVADVLLDPPALPTFDVVIGNPPFLSPLATSTAPTTVSAERLRRRFGPAVRAYTDASALFLVVACALARAGGTVAMIQPQSVIAARDASGVRAALDSVATLREVWLPNGRPFRAAVDVCVPIFDVVSPTDGRVGTSDWCGGLARAHGVPVVHLSADGTVGDEATTSAAFRDEYYGIVPHVNEADSLPTGRRLVTTGLVDLGGAAWGERPARVGGRRWARPVVDIAALEGRAADWARRTAAPKLIIATQTKVVEVFVDADGTYLPGVPLIVAWAAPERLGALAAALCSPPINAWAASRVAGTALTSRSLKLTASLVRAAPLPTDAEAWEAGTHAFEVGDLEGFAEAMTSAYGCEHAVAAWWLARVGSAWSLPRSTR